MTELRDYQQDLLAQVQAALADPSARVMLQLPTGGGKTRIAGELLASWLKGGRKAVWLTHRRELSDQTCRVLNNSGVRAVNSLPWGIDRPAPTWDGGVVILKAQTVSRRNRSGSVWSWYNSGDLLIVDEAHHATAAGWQRAINQWPGPVVGLTATPWRLSKNEGFGHLFDKLIPGPQIKDMQAQGWLAGIQVLMPPPDDLILGGVPTSRGDYNESGIELANQSQPDVMTAGAIRFWQEHASDCQTIVYAISEGHAENLTALFRDDKVSAAVLLGKTPPDERTNIIKQFSDGDLRVLVNVAVATEGFDLPDASCVVLARPTLSLALYLQMVGRGLRPKSNGGNCLILDLSGNIERHGFPEDEREWSLDVRGAQGALGFAPVVRCPDCAEVSPAASHYCRECGNPLGKDCERCGKWRTWKRWSSELECGDEHAPVCNRCHVDAHELDTLPEQLREAVQAELAEGQMEVNPANLQTLDDFRVTLSEIAEAFVYANKVEDFPAFNRLTKQMRSVLRQERRLREVAQEEAKEILASEVQAKFGSLFNEIKGTLTQMGKSDVASLGFFIDLKGDHFELLLNEESLWNSLTDQQASAVVQIVENWIANNEI